MSRHLPLFVFALLWPAVARAVEVRSELTASREFAFFTTDVVAELCGGQLGAGAGVTVVTDYRQPRYGVQGLLEYRGERFSSGLAASFGPRQLGRGWASLDPHAALELGAGPVRFSAELGVLLRRVDAHTGRAPVAVDQLQLHAETRIEIRGRWRLGLFALASFYDVDLASPRWRGADLGLAVTMAGKPERWAVGARGGRRIGRWLYGELSLGGVAYADDRGGALVPRALARVGPFRGVVVEGSVEVVAGLGPAREDSPRAIGGLAIEYER